MKHMFKNMSLVIFIVGVMLMLYSGNVDASTTFASGTGTKEDPYVIENPEQLDAIRGYLSSHFVLGKSIDLTTDTQEESGKFYNEGKGFLPIGSQNYPFTGTFDGKGYTISGLMIQRLEENNIGLFSYLGRDSKISNVIFDKVNIIGNENVGALAGYGNETAIENITVKGLISGFSKVGSVSGYLTRLKQLENVTNFAFVTATQNENSSDIGGIAGVINSESFSTQITIKNLVNKGDIQGNAYSVGGIIGTVYYFQYLDIENAVNLANVTGGSYVGGITGSGGNIKNSNNKGIIKGNTMVGGITGSNTATMEKSYNLGSVTGRQTIGGLTGINNKTIINCYNYADINCPYGTMVGGIAGSNAGKIEETYNVGNITAKEKSAGLVGNNRADIWNCYQLGTVSAGGTSAEIAYENTGMIRQVYTTQSNPLVNQSAGSIINAYAIDGKSDLLIKERLTGHYEENIKALSKEEAMLENTYVGYQFDTIWKKDDALFPYPVLQSNLPNQIAVSDFEITNTAKIQKKAGEDVKVRLQIVFKNPDETQLLQFSSSNEEVAKISENGTVTFQNYGTVTITATSSNKVSKSITFQVQKTSYTIEFMTVKRQSQNSYTTQKVGDSITLNYDIPVTLPSVEMIQKTVGKGYEVVGYYLDYDVKNDSYQNEIKNGDLIQADSNVYIKLSPIKITQINGISSPVQVLGINTNFEIRGTFNADVVANSRYKIVIDDTSIIKANNNIIENIEEFHSVSTQNEKGEQIDIIRDDFITVDFGKTTVRIITEDGYQQNIEVVVYENVKEMYPDDIQGHWGEAILKKWMDRKITSWDKATWKYYPDQYILRSDIMYTLNRILQTKEMANIESIYDVEPSDWYYQDVAKAVKAGYLYPIHVNFVYPTNTLTREEFMTMVSRALGLEKANLAVLEQYEDKDLILDEIKQDVANYINAFGFGGNDLNGNGIKELIPQNLLTKADAFYFIDKAFGDKEIGDIVIHKTNKPVDTRYHWSDTIIESLIDRKVTAYQSITHCFYPDDYILKADIVYTLNRLLKLEEVADISKYTDIKVNDWYYLDYQKAVKAGYLYPITSDKLSPVANVNREEVFTMISRLLKLPTANLAVLDKFEDKALIREEIKQDVANYIGAFGFGGNDLNGNGIPELIPQNVLTKADFMYFLSKIIPMETVEYTINEKMLNMTVTLSLPVEGDDIPTLQIFSSDKQIHTVKGKIENKKIITYQVVLSSVDNLFYQLVGGNLESEFKVPLTLNQYSKEL